MEYTEKILHQSNYWYNDGLRKAKIRDISGAVQSLKRSLQYNRENIPARNLLGLVYYERGEIAEAIVEWILSQNFQKSDNLAGYFIREIQKDKKTLEEIDRAVQMYNQCLVYCDQGAEDGGDSTEEGGADTSVLSESISAFGAIVFKNRSVPESKTGVEAGTSS